ncbi:MAG: gliding motility-associated C-terminal domain-containing protein, partial [Bacteroidales bacterium]|nr:gliding motility-associated C-terminal domain-containing protein [Bacteroidales bacterium]
ESEVACDSFMWHGTKYIESGIYTYDYTNDNDCPSTDTLHLTINYATHNVEMEVACDSLRWHGEKYTESGTYEYDYTNDVGCPSTDTLHLTVNYGTHNAEIEVACDSFMWHGTKYIESGTYEYGYTNDAGCPSTDTLHLTINSTYIKEISDTICDSELPYEMCGERITESGDYEFTVKSVDACDTIIKLHLAINEGSHKIEHETACDSLTWHGTKYTESGTYEYDYTNDAGCPSTDTLHLTINHTEVSDTSVVACESFVWYDERYTESGDYEKIIKSPIPEACDYIARLHLTILHGTHNALADTACDFYVWHDEIYTESGTYFYDYENEEGCLSTDTLHLAVFYSSRYDTVVDVCKNELPFIFLGRSLTRSDEYEFHLETAQGCDSLVVLHLTVYLTYNRQTDITVCDEELPVLFMDSVITKGGDYVFKKKSLHGCDSTVTLHLTVNNSTHDAITELACDSFTWHGTKYMESGTYEYDYTNENGCPSTDTLHLTVHHSTHTAQMEIACDSIIWHDKKYTESGDYIYDYINAEGCPSADTLHLTINYTEVSDTVVVACDSYLWYDELYTESGDYKKIWKSAIPEGCDRVANLHLTIHQSTHASIMENACDSFIWHGTKYTESGVYEYDYTNENGCPSTDTLHLTVNYSTHAAQTEIACDSLIWHDIKYTESGTYLFDYENNEGCSSTDTLHLTVNYSSMKEEELTLCESDLPYTYGDTIFEVGTTSSIYRLLYSTTEGCDSVILLHLDVIPFFEKDIFDTICEQNLPYVIEGEEYVEGGDYEWMKNVQDEGCDTLVKLHLEVTSAPFVFLGDDQQFCTADFESVTLEVQPGFASYQWSNGSEESSIVVYAAGQYWVQVRDRFGCRAADTTEIVLIESPEVTIDMHPENFCMFGSAMLIATVSPSQGVTYLWNTGDQTPSIQVTEPGFYSVLVDNQGCESGDSLTVADCQCDLWVPNAFTPNDDALNDVFLPVPSAALGYFQMLIYDRFGGLIFQTTDINEGWNGQIGGKNAPLGVYAYVIHYACSTHPEFIMLKKGSVTLVR